MKLEALERRFTAYLDGYASCGDTSPFLLVYIQLLLLFESELSNRELSALVERQKQLRGEEFAEENIDQVRKDCKEKMD